MCIVESNGKVTASEMLESLARDFSSGTLYLAFLKGGTRVGASSWGIVEETKLSARAIEFNANTGEELIRAGRPYLSVETPAGKGGEVGLKKRTCAESIYTVAL